MSLSIESSVLGFPRMGSHRQLKVVLEQYWGGKVPASDLLAKAAELRTSHWKLLQQKGLSIIPSNDFSMYDHVLDTAVLFNAIPKTHEIIRTNDLNELNLYFSLARGFQGAIGETTFDLQALEMKKWFDTNYHYLVPELEDAQTYKLAGNSKPVREYLEAKSIGIETRPVILGPLSFLYLSKINGQIASAASVHTFVTFLERLLPIYVELFSALGDAGAKWIQVDEPVLVLDLPAHVKESYKAAYSFIHEKLGKQNSSVSLILTTYFEDLRDNLSMILELPVQGIHLDLVRAPQQYDTLFKLIEQKKVSVSSLSLGVVDGRNIWKSNITSIVDKIQTLVVHLKENAPNVSIIVSSSCSLLHSPHTLTLETKMQEEIKQWLAFATEKVDEITLITRLLKGDVTPEHQVALTQNQECVKSRETSSFIHNPSVKEAVKNITPEMKRRDSPFEVREKVQQDLLQLPLFPTTTIGSFPQTAYLRSLRAKFNAKKLSEEDYNREIREETRKAILKQEEIGLDVLVPAEYERNDMVEFFAQQLEGFVSTSFGWVQSYGSRCVKPAILFGDVRHVKPMIVDMSLFAASVTTKPMKAVLTGPVTILQWTFVRNDQPREITAYQLALAIREEVKALEQAGMKIIQIDEAAIREGLPLQKHCWDQYLKWAIDAFLLSSCTVSDATQIHSHMCYSDFQDILSAIARMDCDVLTIENARSSLKLVQAFATFAYPNMIGPGLYDIHSPRIPTIKEMKDRLQTILEHIKPQQLWVNPDCGLKTRQWEEVEKALTNLVEVARVARQAVSTSN